MRMAPHFEKANEIYFRLGIIYKQQSKFRESLEVCCFTLLAVDIDVDFASAFAGLPTTLLVH